LCVIGARREPGESVQAPGVSAAGIQSLLCVIGARREPGESVQAPGVSAAGIQSLLQCFTFALAN